MASTTAYTAVSSATRRLNAWSRFSPSSWGSGSSTSATGRGRPLPDLFAHRFLARLERVHEALGLLLEHLPALVQPLPRMTLGLTGPLLSALRDLPAALGEKVPRFAAATWGGQERGSGAERSPEEEPPEVAAAVLLIRHDWSPSRFPSASFRRSRWRNTSRPVLRPATTPTSWPARVSPVTADNTRLIPSTAS